MYKENRCDPKLTGSNEPSWTSFRADFTRRADGKVRNGFGLRAWSLRGDPTEKSFREMSGVEEIKHYD